jgi:pantoate kinase
LFRVEQPRITPVDATLRIKPEQPDEVHVDDLVVQVAVLVEDDGAVRTRQRMVDDDLAAGRPLLVV